MTLTPINLKTANAFVQQYHRHHKPTRGHKFSIGVSENGALVGVAICGRPVARRLDDGYTLEVNRLCTDGTPNACSILYAAAYRAARAMGYNKVITYILDTENGSSLKAAGYTCEGRAGGLEWNGAKAPKQADQYGSEKQFGIYQITARDPEHDYRFMGLDYVQKKGITVARADYDLIYAAPLTEKDTLDGIYERFNIQRPADFTGHSLSVSDVVVLNDGESVKAYYVDSIGFAELPDFFKERNIDLQKENLLNEELQEIEIFDKPGLFSNGRLRDEDVPEGLYRYDLRGSDYDPGQPITVEKTVVVNHAASVLMAEELDLGAEGRLELGEEGLNFTGAELTVREFMEEQQQKNNALIQDSKSKVGADSGRISE